MCVEMTRERMREDERYKTSVRKLVLLRFGAPSQCYAKLNPAGQSCSPIWMCKYRAEAAALRADFDLSTKCVPWLRCEDAVVILEASVVYRRRLTLIGVTECNSTLLWSMDAFAEAVRRRFPEIRPRTNAEWARDVLAFPSALRLSAVSLAAVVRPL